MTMRKIHYLSYILLTLLTLFVFAILICARTDLVARNWNPLKELDINAAITPVTKLQMRHALSSKSACIKTLRDAGVEVRALPDFVDTKDERCGIKNRVELLNLGSVKLKPIELNCALALRLVMWSAHEARPLAREIMGSDIAQIEHFGSYNCREMRTSKGNSGKMSKHATAQAIDIEGFIFMDGTRISLLRDWDRAKAGAFLERSHDSACTWFGVVLGPEYNALHKDHFHLDTGAWPVCR